MTNIWEVPTEHDADDVHDQIYLELKGARERLCRAQMLVDESDCDVLGGAIDRIDLVACDLPQWSQRDGGRA